MRCARAVRNVVDNWRGGRDDAVRVGRQLMIGPNATCSILLLGALLFASPAASQLRCGGDCNRDGEVGVDEIVLGVTIALDSRNGSALRQCRPADLNDDGFVSVDELTIATIHSLQGCPCQFTGDCELGMTCVSPGEFAGCTSCQHFDSDCVTTFDCTSRGLRFGSTVCDPVPPSLCPCAPAHVCRQICATDADCGQASICGADDRCQPAYCSSDEDCGSNYMSKGLLHDEELGRCARTSCQSDVVCGDGHCINGSCYAGFGTCARP